MHVCQRSTFLERPADDSGPHIVATAADHIDGNPVVDNDDDSVRGFSS